jgi:branched-subunit amino acid transport protein
VSADLVLVAVLAGLANYGFRVLPLVRRWGEAAPGGAFARFLAATGPAAIATLFAAALLPEIWPLQRAPLPLAAGLAAVIGVFAATRSAIAATLAGALAFGVLVALTGPLPAP